MTNRENQCPCCSGKEYEKCCRPLHEGRLPENALQLMRSRYAAYVFNMPDYIIATTHPASPQYSEDQLSWKRSISDFSQSSSFEKLEILDFKEKETLATVTFTAHIKQDFQDASFTEKSFFEKVHGRWLYRSGQLDEKVYFDQDFHDPLRLLPMAYYGKPILRKKAEPIKEITDDIKQLVDEMIATLDAFGGIGLAAPQIHRSIRLFIIRTPIETGPNCYEPGDVKVFINPKLSLPSKETIKGEEGCLSIPTVRAIVERPQFITVEYTSLVGTVSVEKFSGWEARVIMHENDHLNGMFFIDRLDAIEKSKIDQPLQKLEKRLHDGKVI